MHVPSSPTTHGLCDASPHKWLRVRVGGRSRALLKSLGLVRVTSTVIVTVTITVTGNVANTVTVTATVAVTVTITVTVHVASIATVTVADTATVTVTVTGNVASTATVTLAAQMNCHSYISPHPNPHPTPTPGMPPTLSNVPKCRMDRSKNLTTPCQNHHRKCPLTGSA